MAKNTVILNHSKMSYKLRPGADGKPRVLEPGHSIECLDEKEAADLLDYVGLKDADKVVPQNEKRIADLQDTVDKLTAENETLKKKRDEASTVAPVKAAEPAPKEAETEEVAPVHHKKGSPKKR